MAVKETPWYDIPYWAEKSWWDGLWKGYGKQFYLLWVQLYRKKRNISNTVRHPNTKHKSIQIASHRTKKQTNKEPQKPFRRTVFQSVSAYDLASSSLSAFISFRILLKATRWSHAKGRTLTFPERHTGLESMWFAFHTTAADWTHILLWHNKCW